MQWSLDGYVWKAVDWGEKVDGNGNGEFCIRCRHVLKIYHRIWLLYTCYRLGSVW